jgi:hypothetical protein
MGDEACRCVGVYFAHRPLRAAFGGLGDVFAARAAVGDLALRDALDRFDLTRDRVGH